MRTAIVLGVVLTLATACSAEPDRPPLSDTEAASAVTSASPSAAEPSPVVTSRAPAKGRPADSRRRPEIRRTDWANVTVHGLPFCGEADSSVQFRDGSNGFDIPCFMLPHGARPVYAEFLTEEPASAPVTEDALVLVELGNPGAARQQALVPIQIGFDGRARNARPVIEGDEPSNSGDEMMTFISYRVDDATNNVITKVRTRDGKIENRRYRQANANGDWERI